MATFLASILKTTVSAEKSASAQSSRCENNNLQNKKAGSSAIGSTSNGTFAAKTVEPKQIDEFFAIKNMENLSSDVNALEYIGKYELEIKILKDQIFGLKKTLTDLQVLHTQRIESMMVEYKELNEKLNISMGSANLAHQMNNQYKAKLEEMQRRQKEIQALVA